MSEDVARLAIDAFVRHLEASDRRVFDPQIQFYGGEPLLNWKTLSFAVRYIKELKGRGVLPEGTRLIVVTNGSRVTNEIARFFAENGVSVGLSVDGPQAENDAFRITSKGMGTYGLIKKALRILQEYRVNVTLSVTVNPNIVAKLPDIVRWAKDEMGVAAIGFNAVGGNSFGYTDSPISFEAYNEQLAQGMVGAFQTARELELYEDRVSRKAESFVGQSFRTVDCGALGNQLVVYPNGNVGFCHASTDYDVGSVFDSGFRIFGHPKIREWEAALPINNPKCWSCSAISICGYGCFHNALEIEGTIMAGDRQFCCHTRAVMDFLIWDLYEKTRAEA